MWLNVSESKFYLQVAEQLKRNLGQWAAYQSRGHCVVLAGPGSGKTKTLTAKMARILAEDVHEPRGVACITYNNECARELEQQLASLGVESGGRVFIGTVHSFSLTQIILPYAKVAKLGLPDGFSVATRADKQEALAEVLVNTFGTLQNANDWEFRLGNYRRSILNRNSLEWRERDPVLAELVEAYEDELRHRGLIDYDDMPLLAVRALRTNSWLKQALLAKFPVLFVDEYQDLGKALHSMVMSLCFDTGIRLFAVGDIDQSIYGFTGAHPRLLSQLSEREDVETVRLRLNYRCSRRIVEVSRVALGEGRDYEAVNETIGTVYNHPVSGVYEQQATHLMKELIPQALERHPLLNYSDIAILYPAAWIGDAVASAAEVARIPIVRSDGNALFPRSSRIMQWIELCGQWCCGGWKTGDPSFARLMREGKRLFSEALVTENQILEFNRRLVRVLWEERDANTYLSQWLDRLQRKVIEPYGNECVALGDELEILSRFMERIAQTGERADMVLGEFAGEGEHLDRLTLSTLHSAKGREFPLVFMFGMDRGRLPRHNASQLQLAEARRLFYVGFTRAKIEVNLVYTNHCPSPFVDEIAEYLAES